MKSYNLKFLNKNELICINNLFLIEFIQKIPPEKRFDVKKPLENEPDRDIEVVLRFKAPFFDKNGKKNAFLQSSNKKIKITKDIIIK